MASSRAFTLIELLIVVAIIAILAAIAVPNFLNAQIRAKVARAVSDMRTIATALETYHIDYGKYPPYSADGFAVVPSNLSTPVAYVGGAYITDPFNQELDMQIPSRTRFYTYNKGLTEAEATALSIANSPYPLNWLRSKSKPQFYFKYGRWRLVSNGPDGVYSPGFNSIDIPYDATNGSRSLGNIHRLQNGEPYPRN